jgi:uncharacterized protein YuzE
MSVNIGPWVFDDAEYDGDSDVLYLSIGQPRRGYGQESPEGHVWRFDSDGNFCGLTLFGIGDLVAAGEEMKITVPMPPQPELLDRNSLNRVLVSA